MGTYNTTSTWTVDHVDIAEHIVRFDLAKILIATSENAM